MIFEENGMKENTFSIDELCSIINSCSVNGVECFKGLGLDITFRDTKVSKPNATYPAPIEEDFHGHERKPNKIYEVEDDLDDKYLQDIERDLKAMEAENVLLEDPFLAEQMELMDEQTDDFMDQLDRDE